MYFVCMIQIMYLGIGKIMERWVWALAERGDPRYAVVQ